MLAPDTILQNRYRIVRKLGQGGMGAIYEALDQRVNCVVALKETSLPLWEAFHREAELLANLRHPLLPKVMDYFSEGDGEFLVMEYIAGNDLLELLELRGGPLPQLQVLSWAVELLKLLEYLHTHEPSILHRDIKPANIKKTSKGEIFLLDFGLAKGATGQMHTVSTDRSVPGYTPIYSPLEQIIGQGTDQRSDIYSLGATLYHLLTGQPPVSAPGRFNAIENNQPDPLKPAHQVNVEIAPEVAACIQKAMALSRRERTETVQAMRAQLEEAIRLITDREIARKAEQQLLDTTPDRDPAKPLIVDEGVHFTVYAPEKIKPDKNYSMLAFAHLAKRRAGAAPDEPDPIEEVKSQAARFLGEQREDYRDTKDSSSRPVPRGGQLIFVPVVKGLTFNPPSRSFTWEKSVHREEFDVRASREVDGQTPTGTMTVFLGSLVIADVELTISVDSHATPASEKISLDKGRSARRVKQVFASYSREDEQVVAELAQVAPIFGSRFLLDRTHLEPGEDRVQGLQRLIRDADVFQLFWSHNSMRSPEIADEIKYAAGLDRPGFILPTYWEEPIPRSTSEGLPPPEIDRLQFYRIYPGAISQSLQTKAAETRLVILGPPGAEIYLDDERQGSIGSSGRVILKSIAIGKHVLRLTRSGDQDDERVIDVQSGGSEQILQTFLKPATAAGASPSPTHRTASASIDAAPQASAATGSASPTKQMPPAARRSSRWMVPVFAGAAMVLFLMAVTPVWFMMSSSRNNPVASSASNTNSPMNSPSNTNSTANVSTNANSNSGSPLDPGSKFLGINGRTYRFEDFEGRVVVLNFWATRSVPSKSQVPVLNALEKRYGSRGLTVIGLSKGDAKEEVSEFQKQTPQEYLIGLSDSEIESQFPAPALPVTYLIDRLGRVRKTMIGMQSLESLQAAIEPLLNE